MAILYGFLVFIEVVSGLLLVGAVLIQKAKSHGAGLAFGAGVGESLFGARVGNVLTRTTVVLGIVFLVNTTLLSVVGPHVRKRSVIETTEGMAPAAAPVTPASPAAPLPGEGMVPETPVTEPGAGPVVPDAAPPAEMAPVPETPVEPEGSGQ